MGSCCSRSHTTTLEVPQLLTFVSPQTACVYADTVPFVPNIRSGMVVKVYDGDTITIAAQPVGCADSIYRFSVRLRGIDTAEMTSKDPTMKMLAVKARDYVADKCLNQEVVLGNIACDKYGRVLANVFVNDLCLNKELLDRGLAIPYNGGTKCLDEFSAITA